MRIIKYWLPIIIWMGIIFYLSSIPGLQSGLDNDFILRKIAHIMEYAILTFLLLRAFNAKTTKKILITALISIAYAASDEYHQSFVLNRHGSLIDVGIDSIGVFLTSIMWYIKNRNN
ncbi:MAG: VanZ family protein [Candidatus Portnoybacteria bacterium]|nr:VanZ family protein [Candidatus Portnoybacteria bacterium]